MSSKRTSGPCHDKDEVIIDWPHVAAGIDLTLKNAKRLLDDGNLLYNNNKNQSAIPILILSIEESLKGSWLAVKFRKQETLSRGEWRQLQNHKYKLTHIFEWACKIMAGYRGDHKELSQELGVDRFISSNEAISNLQDQIFLMSSMKKLKEKCFYVDWHEEWSEWDVFHSMSAQQQNELAYFILTVAKNALSQFHYSLEHAVNVLRRIGMSINSFGHPSYSEYRKPIDYETPIGGPPIDDQTKSLKGLHIFETLHTKRAFGVIDQIQTHELVRKCIKIMRQNDSLDWYPHPLIKAVCMAVAQYSEALEGKFAAISGNAEQTYSGKPTMVVIVESKKSSGMLTVEKIWINNEQYDLQDDVIYKIMQAERIIEQKPGQDLPLDVMHKALAKIGLKFYVLKPKEVKMALARAHEALRNNKMSGLHPNIVREIISATDENWDDLSSIARSTVCNLYGLSIGQSVVMTHVDPIRKFKVRDIIHTVLTERNYIRNMLENKSPLNLDQQDKTA